MSYLVLARKWRPKGFDDLSGQEPIVRILKNAVTNNRIAHAYLFSGPRGVGKTSSARILAKALNCKDGPTANPCGVCASCSSINDGSSVDVIEIDGASNNSVDDIRDLRERVKYAPSGGKYKVYIIDEVHMLSSSAFNALLKTLEEPPSHVIFVLATTEMKKIPATVISRCQHMPFRRIPGSVIRDRLRHISESEGIGISNTALGLVARAADGSMRDSLTILDQISSYSSEIDEEQVKSLLGIADFGLLSRISRALITGNRVDVLETVNMLTEQGADIRSFTKELVQFFRDLLVVSVVKDNSEILDLGADEIAAMCELAGESSEDQLTLMLSELMKAESDVRQSSAPRLALEMALIRASFLSSMKPLKEVIEHIDRFRGQLTSVPSPTRLTESIDKKQTQESNKTITEEDTAPPADAEPAVIQTGPETSDPVTAPDTPDIPEIWTRVLAKIDAPLASKLQQTTVEMKGDELFLVLDGGHSVFEESIKKNLKTIEKVVNEEFGRKLKIRISSTNRKSVKKSDLKEKVLAEPLIKEALELFEGRIVDVTPAEKK